MASQHLGEMDEIIELVRQRLDKTTSPLTDLIASGSIPFTPDSSALDALNSWRKDRQVATTNKTATATATELRREEILDQMRRVVEQQRDDHPDPLTEAKRIVGDLREQLRSFQRELTSAAEAMNRMADIQARQQEEIEELKDALQKQNPNYGRF